MESNSNFGLLKWSKRSYKGRSEPSNGLMRNDFKDNQEQKEVHPIIPPPLFDFNGNRIILRNDQQDMVPRDDLIDDSGLWSPSRIVKQPYSLSHEDRHDLQGLVESSSKKIPVCNSPVNSLESQSIQRHSSPNPEERISQQQDILTGDEGIDQQISGDLLQSEDITIDEQEEEKKQMEPLMVIERPDDIPVVAVTLTEKQFYKVGDDFTEYIQRQVDKERFEVFLEIVFEPEDSSYLINNLINNSNLRAGEVQNLSLKYLRLKNCHLLDILSSFKIPGILLFNNCYFSNSLNHFLDYASKYFANSRKNQIGYLKFKEIWTENSENELSLPAKQDYSRILAKLNNCLLNECSETIELEIAGKPSSYEDIPNRQALIHWKKTNGRKAITKLYGDSFIMSCIDQRIHIRKFVSISEEGY
ncbi:unnamed protein product [Moneuplotes crassus]|uniref:Uncharacterized protein n=1 Tax=Euplotes crassus TaxID=5936 RepID=A0AAD1UFF2_EUPCR|nr:unnamed protein product [Moneuplotes crassus]